VGLRAALGARSTTSRIFGVSRRTSTTRQVDHQWSAKRAPSIAVELVGRIQSGHVIGEEPHNLIEAVTGRGHGLDHVAGVYRVIVTVEGDVLAVLFVRGEEPHPVLLGDRGELPPAGAGGPNARAGWATAWPSPELPAVPFPAALDGVCLQPVHVNSPHSSMAKVPGYSRS
jgi:hypothetical protein